METGNFTIETNDKTVYNNYEVIGTNKEKATIKTANINKQEHFFIGLSIC